MKLHVLSDLHLGVAAFEPPHTDADLVILAGDIARPDAAIGWARRFDKPVLYVAGNHEFYGSSVAATLARLRELTAGTRITLLDCEAALIQGVRFLGATLWTDFRLEASSERRENAQSLAQTLVRDFSRIRAASGDDAFSPADSATLFDHHSSWLDRQLATPHAGPTVVITHHAPSPLSIHPRFADSPINSCFVSNAEWLLGREGNALWIHGHTHDSFDYRVGSTRVMCNPRGYCRNGAVENPQFDPLRVVEIA